MDNNQISDLRPLANLFNLHTLSLSNNNVSDIQSLANLVNMEWLDLSNNRISDIGPLANLKWFILNNNQISDISPLVNNAGLGNGEMVELRNNPLDLSPGSDDMQNIETLRSRG
jgi:Leucine-rich repeat (LRR) protein